MGFGAGSVLTVIPIATKIKSSGYQTTLLHFGFAQGLVVVVLAWFMRKPDPAFRAAHWRGDAAATPRASAGREYTPMQMATTPLFRIMYLMFVMMAAVGLMATAQLGPIAKDFQTAEVPLSILGLTLPTLTFALSIDRVLNGVTRPFSAGCRTRSAANTPCSSPS